MSGCFQFLIIWTMYLCPFICFIQNLQCGKLCQLIILNLIILVYFCDVKCLLNLASIFSFNFVQFDDLYFFELLIFLIGFINIMLPSMYFLNSYNVAFSVKFHFVMCGSLCHIMLFEKQIYRDSSLIIDTYICFPFNLVSQYLKSFLFV